MEHIEVSYISPASQYKFNKHMKYTLILSYTLGDKAMIIKMGISKIDNVTAQVRGYGIKKTIRVPISKDVVVNLMEYNPTTNRMKLIFRGNLTRGQGRYYVTLRPLYVLNRTAPLSKTCYIAEQFYNFIHRKTPTGYCLLFLNKPYRKSRFPIINTSNIDTRNIVVVYDKYHNMLVKESSSVSYSRPIQTYHYKHVSYPGSASYYQIDEAQYNPQTGMIYPEYRPIYRDPYSNNIMIAPVDGRVRGFAANPTIRLAIGGTSATPYNMDIQEDLKSCFYFRVCPQDSKTVSFPYNGRVTKIYKKKVNGVCLDIFKVDNSYYMAPSIHERDYLSVLRGNHTYGGPGVGAGSRGYPELLQPQPDSHLTYYLIVVGGNTHMKHKKVPSWAEQGEVIGKVNGGSVIVLCNRKMSFAEDIKYYGSRAIDCLRRMNDIVGYLD